MMAAQPEGETSSAGRQSPDARAGLDLGTGAWVPTRPRMAPRMRRLDSARLLAAFGILVCQAGGPGLRTIRDAGLAFFVMGLVLLGLPAATQGAQIGGFGGFAANRARRLLPPWRVWSAICGGPKRAERARSARAPGAGGLRARALPLWFAPFACALCQRFARAARRHAAVSAPGQKALIPGSVAAGELPARALPIPLAPFACAPCLRFARAARRHAAVSAPGQKALIPGLGTTAAAGGLRARPALPLWFAQGAFALLPVVAGRARRFAAAACGAVLVARCAGSGWMQRVAQVWAAHAWARTGGGFPRARALAPDRLPSNSRPLSLWGDPA